VTGVLILGGTTEGRELAAAFTSRGVPVISSLAGRLSNPRLPDGEVRIGGFGGIEGLAGYLRERGITAVVDATHPFAAGMTANATEAGRRAGIPLLVVRRPAWAPVPGDRWYEVSDEVAAAAAITPLAGPDGRVLLTTGRQGVGVFAGLPQRFWLRAVEPPAPLERPGRCELLLERGPFTLDSERSLLRRLAIDVLVTKNSGGPMTAAKLTAARELGLPVVIIDRPPLPPGVDVAADVPTAVTWALRHLPSPTN
jgi:precorrin-6A/cobalt-precorrin-6A reductase